MDLDPDNPVSLSVSCRRRGREVARQAAAQEEALHSLMLLAARLAHSRGMGREDIEDCAMEAVLFLLQALNNGERPVALSSDLIRHYAENTPRNFCRSARKWAARHIDTMKDETDEPALGVEARAWSGPPPHDTLVRAELWQLLRGVMRPLRPTTRALLMAHHVEDFSMEALAARSGCSVHAVEQRLYRARQRLRLLLERCGYTEAELRSYLQD